MKITIDKKNIFAPTSEQSIIQSAIKEETFNKWRSPLQNDVLLFLDTNCHKNAASTTFHNAVEPVASGRDRHIARFFINPQKSILVKASNT